MNKSLICAGLALATCGCAADDTPKALLEDQIWTVADSPVQLTQDLVIPPGVTLTIEPGVTVELSAERTLTIQGQLLARGTEENPILFTSAEPTMRWGSVIFSETAVGATFERVHHYVGGSIVEHCILEQAHKALRITGSSPFVHRSTFRDNEIPGSVDIAGGAAIEVQAGAAPRIAECRFENNIAAPFAYGGAIYVEKADPIIQSNVFEGSSAIYGGALATDLMASPIVGNTFEGNETGTEGGGASLISTTSAFMGNQVRGNHAGADGGGVHVCVTCFPHSNPLIIDNLITNNTSAAAAADEGAAGLGAAYVRALAHNDIHGNLRAGQPSDFGWFQLLEEGYPPWVANPTLSDNWWGTTDSAAIAETIFDGTDDPLYGTVFNQPAAGPHAGASPSPLRVTITTRKIRYLDEGDEMPVFLTVYNPGEPREVELRILLQYGEGALLQHGGALDFPEAEQQDGSYLLPLPAAAVYFTRLVEPAYSGGFGASHGYWHAAIFDPASGQRLGDVSSVRFELGEEGSGAAVPLVSGVSAEVGGAAVAVGDTLAVLTAALGAPGLTRDLGDLGVLFGYPGLHLTGVLAGGEPEDAVLALSLWPGAAGQAEGIAQGDSPAVVEAALGATTTEPFLNGWFYQEQGLAVQWEQSQVATIHVF